MTVSQNSYEVFQLPSPSFLVFPWENSVLLAHHFTDITTYIKFYLSSQHPRASVLLFALLFANLLYFKFFNIKFSFMNNVQHLVNNVKYVSVTLCSVQTLIRVRLFETP